jgi:putative sterol carrier protein
MAYFKDAGEVYANLGTLFQDVMADDELGPRFKAANTIVQYRFRNPDSAVTVKMLEDEDSQVDFGATSLQPEVILVMDADTGHRLWLGHVNVTVALARGEIKARGPVAKILRLVPLAQPVFPRYKAQLEAAGREDLVLSG